MWSFYRLYLNIIQKKFIQYGNNIMMEDYIVEALSFQGGLVGKNVVVLGCSNLTFSHIAQEPFIFFIVLVFSVMPQNHLYDNENLTCYIHPSVFLPLLD